MTKSESTAFTISFPKEKLLQIDMQGGDVPRSRFLLRAWEKAYDKKSREEVL